MESLNQQIETYRKELEKGTIIQAYRGLLSFAKELKTHLEQKYPSYSFSAGMYQGQMDITYFTFTPPDLSERKLKIALAFIHETIRWEIWLVGVNQKVQVAYAQLFREQLWLFSPLKPVEKTVGSITEMTLVEHPDYENQESLIRSIEEGALQFIAEVQHFLAAKPYQ